MRAFRIAMATLQLLLALGAGAKADVFHNSYLSFELPPGWKCNLEVTEWVCEDREGDQKTAIIVVAAKEQGSEDRLDAFEDLLSATNP